MAISRFLLPKPHGLKARTSSITNAFINGVLPVEVPTDDEINEALSFFNQQHGSPLTCVYCGNPASEWDHLRPLIKDKRPTGEYTHIRNLVPACGKCNQSKGNNDWKRWMLSRAPLSPTTRCVVDVIERIARLEQFEEWGTSRVATHLELQVGTELWQEYEEALAQVYLAINRAEIVALKLKIITRKKA
ncbi:MAG: HNH endonuclease [Polaromonas sp.]|uniref:HNH endonuclease signature motif containing protein n=1 Tax=Polaromonas sp. TaxID=1869339 RepID=UPI002736D6A6|nr:HNH endonuclease [Polaromonas sp.]MDP2817208.1 HNH endonuclease [Polaromonas sp.]